MRFVPRKGDLCQQWRRVFYFNYFFQSKNIFSVTGIVDICDNRTHQCQLWKMLLCYKLLLLTP